VGVIGDTLKDAGIVSRSPRGGWTERNVVAALLDAAAYRPKSHGGLILFIDEMGKLLEAAAQDGSDIYILQELAEAASRSDKRLLIVGVLHQAFEEYAHRLSHEMRDEWAKIQGRFIDLVVDTAGEEQVDLISRAIESDHRSREPGRLPLQIAKYARRDRSSADVTRLALTGTLLAAPSRSRLPTWSDLPPTLRTEPAKYLWLLNSASQMAFRTF